MVSKFKGMSSMQVFQQFISNDRTGMDPGRSILSAQCFEAWKASRKSTLKNPEKSFRRAIICHLMGTDNRHPFNPDIEASLLRILREEADVWEQVFGRRSKNIGVKPFRQNGYHESLSKIEISENRTDNKDFFEQGYLCLDFAVPGVEISSLSSQFGSLSVERAHESISRFFDYYKLHKRDILEGAVIHEFFSCLTKYCSPQHLLTTVASAFDAGIHLFSPATIFTLSGKGNSNIDALGEENAFPKGQDKAFDPYRTTGVAVVHPQSLRILDHNDEFSELHGGQLHWQHILNCIPAVGGYLEITRFLWNLPINNGSFTVRSPTLSYDGHKRVCKLNISKYRPPGAESHLIVIKMQDETERFSKFVPCLSFLD